MLIKIENQQPVNHPLTEENFRYLFPAEVFPLILTNAIVEPFGYAMYDFSQRPEIRWDQDLIEGTPTKDQYGIWRQQWIVQDLSGEALAQRLTERKVQMMRLVDRDVDNIYSATIGNRATEYLLAETEARSYKDAGYQGPVPSTVDAWATVKGWTTQAAADDVITAADTWRSAQMTIRTQRLSAKDTLSSALTAADVDLAMSNWASFVTAIRQHLAGT